MSHQPAIIAIGFNRPLSLKRLLSSLQRANYSDSDINLVISIDFSDSKQGAETRQIADEFQWEHGQKKLLVREQNLGLRSHVLACGDLVSEYGSIIMLEDDVSVGPEFYKFATEALDFTASDSQVGGVSLYNHCTNFVCQLPFESLYDGFDNYYLQIAQSWGQAWSQQQWTAFREWYDGLSESALSQIPDSVPIPRSVANWPKSSWLKYFIWHLVEFEKYFLYPRQSHTTNNADAGTHAHHRTSTWQVPVAFKTGDLRFSTVTQSHSVYDSFFELLPDRFKTVAPRLKDYEFDVDLFGTKPLTQLKKPFTLTSKAINGSPELSFDLAYKPMVANFVERSTNPEKATFSLSKRELVTSEKKISMKSMHFVQYFFGFVPVRTLAKNMFRYFLQSKFRGSSTK